MNRPSNAWHFARPDLASGYLSGFDLGLVAARGLFARRRMGKTEFLKQDLLPAAAAQGYLSAYTNLWDDADHPGQALATALWQAVQPRGLARLWSGLQTPVQKVKAGAKLPAGVEASIELDLAEREKLSAPALQAALQAADRQGRKLLLVIDEAQVLALPQHRNLAHSLRSGLDTRKDGIKVLFAGSSEAALRDMFSKAAAPFFNWAPVEPFPLLGETFVEHMVDQVRRLGRQPLSRPDALQAFAALRETPEFFRWFIERYLLNQDLGFQSALEVTLARVQDETGFGKQWKSLGRNDRAVLLLAAQGVQDLYSAAALKQLRLLLGDDSLTATVQRSALRRLTSQKLQVLARIDHGHYRFEDQELQGWIASRRTVD